MEDFVRWYSPRDWIEGTPPAPATPPNDESCDQEGVNDTEGVEGQQSVSGDEGDGWEGEEWAVIDSDDEQEATNEETEVEIKPKMVRNIHSR